MLLPLRCFVLVFLALLCAVTSGQAEQVRLAWDVPLQSDGQPLATLAGYTLHYGSSSRTYQTTVPLGIATTYTVADLSAGQTYYFAVKAYTTDGKESTFSDELRVTVTGTTPGDNTIPQQGMHVVSVDSEELGGDNYAAILALDGRPETMWHSEWRLSTPKHPHTLVLDLGGMYAVDGWRYLPRQDGNPNGTIAAYEFYVSADGSAWGAPAAAGTLAANTTEKTGRFTAKTGRFVRLVALSSINDKPYTSAAELNILGTPTASTPPPSDSDGDGLSDAQEIVLGTDAQQADTDHDGLSDGTEVTTWHTNPLLADTDGDGLLDGAETTTHHTDPLQADTDGDGLEDGAEITAGRNPQVADTPAPPPPPDPTPSAGLIPQQQLRVVSVDSQDLAGGNYAAVNALDGNPSTLWHTEWKLSAPRHPHTLVLDLGGMYAVDGWRYLPRQDGSPNGTIATYAFYVSTDGASWGTPVVSGTLASNTTEKTVRFAAKTGRFVRLVALSEINGKPYTNAAELNIFGTSACNTSPAAVTLAATPTTLTAGDAVTIAWTASGATACTASQGWTGAKTPASGSETLFPATTTTYTLACSNACGLTTRHADVTVSTVTPPASLPSTTAYRYGRWEMTLSSTKAYANPFADVTVSVTYTKPGSDPLSGYGFWDGGSTFKLRQAFPEPGIWHYKTTATNPSDSGLHNREGNVEVLPYSGSNPFYRHGFVQVSPNRRALEHADGTPFLWIGDTLWGATVWLSEASFHAAIADRRAQHFTVLQTNFARKAEVDTAGDTPWAGDRWNVRFMQKLDRMFNDANDQGMYLFVNGLIDLLWDRNIAQYERLVQMIAIRYAAHQISFASSMDDPYNGLHEQINAAVQRVAPRHLLAQHPGSALNGQGNVWTAEQYYDTPLVDYVMSATGVEGDLELACRYAIEWSLRLHNHTPPKPVINGETWYEGLRGGSGEIAAHLGYLSLLSGNAGYTYGTSLWNATDADLPDWKAFRGATYMQYLYDFFMALDGGRPLQPRPELIQNQPTRYQERMALGVTTDSMTYAAFLPKGGTISLDLSVLAGNVGVTWYNPFTGQYRDQGTAFGGAIRPFVSPFGSQAALLVLMVQDVMPLVVTAVDVAPNPPQIIVTYNQPVDAASAQDVNNYFLPPALSILDATLADDGHSVTLELAPPPASGAYTLAITGVASQDVPNNVISADTEMSVFLTLPQEAPVPVISAWTFEEGAGSVVHDTSGNGLHGTLFGSPKWVAGKVGLALQFNGFSDAVRLPPPNIATDTITLVGWVKGEPMSSWAGLFYARDSVQSIGLSYYSSTRQLGYTWNDNNAATWGWSGGPLIPANEWTLVALSIEPGKAVLYAVSESTGMQARTNAISHRMQTLDTEFFLAHDVLRSNRRFQGLIDEVRIFDGALSSAEIQAIYNSER